MIKLPSIGKSNLNNHSRFKFFLELGSKPKGGPSRRSSPADVFDFIIDLSQALNSASYIWDYYHYIFQSKVFVLVNDDGHAFDIWEYILGMGSGPASPSCKL